jgi:peptidoglycan/xylan/chitin deacetylase (PgdA/CDA1 family)
VLDTIGGRDLGLGDDLPYVESAWEQVERGERPRGDELAEAFFHLARVEERARDGARDAHGRFPASASCLDLLDPPLERLRRKLRLEPPRFGRARFAVALTHDVDTPWRWTGVGVRRAGGRLRDHVLAGRAAAALREARGLAGVPLHRLRGTDPNWSFARMLRLVRARGAASTFYVMGGHHHPADGAAPQTYERLRPRLVSELRSSGAEIGLHGSYLAAERPSMLREEKEALEALAGPVHGHRFHYLRVDPHANLPQLARLGFAYDTSLGFADSPGFRAGIAHPFRPWNFAQERPLDLVEVPLAVMDATLAEQRYLGLTATQAESVLLRLLRYASEHGGGFSVLWHNDRFDPPTAQGWDRLFIRFIEAVRAHGGVCVAAATLAAEASAWLS